ncbi:wax ester/triacylglycerol synthase domain-containing protein [Gordonia sp. CPCC 205515]|uniref:wax ester/triacylglycerol synthase domain-containing protein n=1 Tax=Gordonia sp. CPCC 205515 TaxID=3140791 RepID=UPI003AF384A3
MTGPDALMLNMETPSTPMHTLKVAVLDPLRRGRPVTLAELVDVLPRYLGMFPRATQKLRWLPGYPARPFWVHDNDFDVSDHLDERYVAVPGVRADLDAVLADLAVEQLDRARPLWALTLVHGLAGGRQAVVVRVHHAVADGLAALNTFMAATSAADGRVSPAPVADIDAPHDHRTLWQAARSESWRLLRGVPTVVSDFAHAARVKRSDDGADRIPVPLTVRRNSFNARSGAQRVCASASIPLASVQRIAVATDTTVNGALHGIIAGAMRAELLARGEEPGVSVTVFGVCRDLTSTRTHGNEIATAAAYLRTDIADPVARVVGTAESCAATVRRRRDIGFDLTEKVATYTGRLGPVFRGLAAHRAPLVMNNITTANMPGPRETRWIGDIEVVDWISFALAIAPADVNLTAYSYAGRISMGLIATPESMPDPAGFLDRVGDAVTELEEALHVSDASELAGEPA